jgi:hypothetical protein
MFQAVPLPIIGSSNCTYSFWYLSNLAAIMAGMELKFHRNHESSRQQRGSSAHQQELKLYIQLLVFVKPCCFSSIPAMIAAGRSMTMTTPSILLPRPRITGTRHLRPLCASMVRCRNTQTAWYYRRIKILKRSFRKMPRRQRGVVQV